MVVWHANNNGMMTAQYIQLCYSTVLSASSGKTHDERMKGEDERRDQKEHQSGKSKGTLSLKMEIVSTKKIPFLHPVQCTAFQLHLADFSKHTLQFSSQEQYQNPVNLASESKILGEAPI